MSTATAAARRRGTWPILLLLALAFLLLFWWQRGRSGFLAIEAERAQAVALADRSGLQLAEVFALRDLIGVEASVARWQAAATEFAAAQPRLGAGLAAVVVAAPTAAERAAVDAAVRAADGDAERAWQRFRLRAEALPGMRFLAMRERFAARAAAAR